MAERRLPESTPVVPAGVDSGNAFHLEIVETSEFLLWISPIQDHLTALRCQRSGDTQPSNLEVAYSVPLW